MNLGLGKGDGERRVTPPVAPTECHSELQSGKGDSRNDTEQTNACAGALGGRRQSEHRRRRSAVRGCGAESHCAYQLTRRQT